MEMVAHETEFLISWHGSLYPHAGMEQGKGGWMSKRRGGRGVGESVVLALTLAEFYLFSKFLLGQILHSHMQSLRANAHACPPWTLLHALLLSICK